MSWAEMQRLELDVRCAGCGVVGKVVEVRTPEMVNAGAPVRERYYCETCGRKAEPLLNRLSWFESRLATEPTHIVLNDVLCEVAGWLEDRHERGLDNLIEHLGKGTGNRL